jgi:hypothetical protein
VIARQPSPRALIRSNLPGPRLLTLYVPGRFLRSRILFVVWHIVLDLAREGLKVKANLAGGAFTRNPLNFR